MDFGCIERRLSNVVSFSRMENGLRVCNPYGGELSYEAYLTHLLTEVGYVLIYLSPFEKMLEFIHEEDSKMKSTPHSGRRLWVVSFHHIRHNPMVCKILWRPTLP